MTKPAWTAVVFEHPGMAEAMKGLFEDYWSKSHAVEPGAAAKPDLPLEAAQG